MSGSTGLKLPLACEPRLQAAVLAGITLLVFAPTLSSGFAYDSRLQILTDPFLHDPANWWPVLRRLAGCRLRALLAPGDRQQGVGNRGSCGDRRLPVRLPSR